MAHGMPSLDACTEFLKWNGLRARQAERDAVRVCQLVLAGAARRVSTAAALGSAGLAVAVEVAFADPDSPAGVLALALSPFESF